MNQVVGGARYVYDDVRDAYRDLRGVASDAYDRAAATVEHGRKLASEAARRSRGLRERASKATGRDRVLSLRVAAGVGFALATAVGRRSA